MAFRLASSRAMPMSPQHSGQAQTCIPLHCGVLGDVQVENGPGRVRPALTRSLALRPAIARGGPRRCA
eukprot:15475175-Alexandrium_andersonii.AAC.1